MVANFLVAAMIVLGLILLVVPGVIVYLRTRFVPYLVVEDRLDPVSAIRESFDLTEGLSGTLLGITALGWLAVLVGCIPFMLGVVPALIWWDLSVASLYHGALLCEGDLVEGAAPLTDPSIA